MTIDPKYLPYLRADRGIDWEAWYASDEAKAEQEELDRRLALPWDEWRALYEGDAGVTQAP